MAFERMTGQRRLILEAVLRADDHPTAMQVYERVAASMPNVSLTTVYRNLNLLVETGEIRRISCGIRSGSYRRRPYFLEDRSRTTCGGVKRMLPEKSSWTHCGSLRRKSLWRNAKAVSTRW